MTGDFPKNSLNFHEKHTFSEKGFHFCEFCEKDACSPRVELVDVLKIVKDITEKLTDGLSLTPVASLAIFGSKSGHSRS